MTDFKAKMH